MFNKPEYPIEYNASFVAFWGPAMSISLFIGGMLMFSLCAFTLLILMCHEHAHLAECKRIGVKINRVWFTYLGGNCDVEIETPQQAVPVLMAAVINSGIFAAVFTLALAMIYLFRPNGFNMVLNPWLSWVTSCATITLVLSISNCIPGTYHHKIHGPIRTDGWGAWVLSREIKRVDEGTKSPEPAITLSAGKPA